MQSQNTAKPGPDASPEAPHFIAALDFMSDTRDFLRAAEMASEALDPSSANALMRVLRCGLAHLAEAREHIEFASSLSVAIEAKTPTADAASHVAVAGAAPERFEIAVSVQPSSVLVELIETFRGIRGRRLLLDAQIAAVLNHPDCPASPRVVLTEFVGRPRDYQMDDVPPEYVSTGQLMAAFGTLLRRGGKETFMTRRIRSDLETGKRLMLEREELYKGWITAHGVPLIESESEQFFEKECDLETRICNFPCASAADLLLKVDFARRYLVDDGVDYVWQNAAIIQSAFNFLAGNGGANGGDIPS